MKAAVFDGGELTVQDVGKPTPHEGEVLVRVLACGLCRTDLHILDGELGEPKENVILGHQVVGVVESGGERFSAGQRVGVPWLASTDGTCGHCERGEENLCEKAEFTGYTRDGGLAEFIVAQEDYCIPLPDGDAERQAPLLCAGLVGYRALRKCPDGGRIGFYGFGSSAHILTQVAEADVYAFTRPGDERKQAFAKRLGAVWAGGSDERPLDELDAAIIFAPVGELVPRALKAVRPGGTVVCAGIHMSDIPGFPYRLLWEERTLTSVANLTREDARLFFGKADGVETNVTTFPLERIDEAVKALQSGVEGSVVVRTAAG